MSLNTAPDLIDILIDDWNRERPGSKPESMAIVGRIMRLGRKFHDDVNGLLRSHGISYSDFDVLATLRRHGAPFSLSPTELAQTILLSSGAMTACLTRLEGANLIMRADHVSDRRSRSARLTNEGVVLVEALIDRRFELAEHSVRGLNERDKQALENLLRRLAHN